MLLISAFLSVLQTNPRFWAIVTWKSSMEASRLKSLYPNTEMLFYSTRNCVVAYVRIIKGEIERRKDIKINRLANIDNEYRQNDVEVGNLIIFINSFDC